MASLNRRSSASFGIAGPGDHVSKCCLAAGSAVLSSLRSRQNTSGGTDGPIPRFHRYYARTLGWSSGTRPSWDGDVVLSWLERSLRVVPKGFLHRKTRVS